MEAREVIDVFLLLVMWLTPIGLTYAAIRIDRRRLRPEELARAWNAATTGAVVFWFSPFCIVVHAWRTRRGLRGLGAGLLWLSIILLVLVASTLLLDQVFPET